MTQIVKRNMPSDAKVRFLSHVCALIFKYLLNDTLVRQ